MITVKIETPADRAERAAQAFYAKFGRRPYGLAVAAVERQFAQDFRARVLQV